LNVRVVSKCADQEFEERKLAAANDDESLIQGVSPRSYQTVSGLEPHTALEQSRVSEHMVSKA